MVKVEVDGLWVSIPIKAHMHVDEFLRIADKLEQLGGATPRTQETISDYTPDFTPSRTTTRTAKRPSSMPLLNALHGQSSLSHSAPEDLRFHQEHEKRLTYIIDHLRQQLARLEQAEHRLEGQENHTQHILEYLQSLDHYIRQ